MTRENSLIVAREKGKKIIQRGAKEKKWSKREGVAC